MNRPPSPKTQKPEHVEPRERDVAGADHQRNEVVAEGGCDRHTEQEHHRGAVHREELVVPRRAQDRPVRLCELQPDEQRLDATDAEEHQRERGVHDRDLLVVDRGDPAELAGRRARPLEEPDAPPRSLDDRSCVFDSRHLPTHSGSGVGLGFVAVSVSRKQAIFCASACVMPSALKFGMCWYNLPIGLREGASYTHLQRLS